MPEEKHPVNVLFSKPKYANLVRRATELTLREGRHVSVAELVRRLILSGEHGSYQELETSNARADSD